MKTANTYTAADLKIIFKAAHFMTRRTVESSKRKISYAATFSAALKIAYAEYGKSAAEIWNSYSDTEKYSALKSMAGYEYQHRESRMMRKNGQIISLPNVWTWVSPAAVAQAVEMVANDAYIYLDGYFTNRPEWALSRMLSRAVIAAAQYIDRQERRNPSALKNVTDDNGNALQVIDLAAKGPTAEHMPAPESAAIINDAIYRAARDDTDRLIIKAKAAGYSNREISERIGMTHTAINKRLASIRRRYDEQNGITA